jgi:hypothetical protein
MVPTFFGVKNTFTLRAILEALLDRKPGKRHPSMIHPYLW